MIDKQSIARVSAPTSVVRPLQWWQKLLLLCPYLFLLYPPLYVRMEPVWLGFPFFYWYQFVWVLITAGLTGIVYWSTR